MMLEGVVKILNEINEKFQNQRLQVHYIKKLSFELLKNLSEVVFKEFNPENESAVLGILKEFQMIKLASETSSINPRAQLLQLFYEDAELFNIMNRCFMILARLEIYKFNTEDLQVESCIAFGKNVMTMVLWNVYLHIPYEDPVVDSLEFVTFSEAPVFLHKKIEFLNSKFRILPNLAVAELLPAIKIFCSIFQSGELRGKKVLEK